MDKRKQVNPMKEVLAWTEDGRYVFLKLNRCSESQKNWFYIL